MENQISSGEYLPNYSSEQNQEKQGHQQREESQSPLDEEEQSSPGPSVAKTNRVLRKKAEMKCSVCGRPCLYCYYNVRCCEGCKQFFRRAIVKQKQWRCGGKRKCNIQAGEKCKSCRLDQCILMGMQWRLVNLPTNERTEQYFEKLVQLRNSLLIRSYTPSHSSSPSSNDGSGHSISAAPPLDDFQSAKGLRPAFPVVHTPLAPQLSFEFRCSPAVGGSCFSPSASAPKIPIVQPQNVLNQQLNNSYACAENIKRTAYQSCQMPNLSYFEHYKILEDLIQANMNVLANTDSSLAQMPQFQNPEMLVNKTVPKSLDQSHDTRVLVLSIALDFAKTFAVLQQLESQDQLALMVNFTLPATKILLCYYSMVQGSRVILDSRGANLIERLHFGQYASDFILKNLVDKVYCKPMEEFIQVAPSKEEIVLLLALLLTNGASQSLSSHAKAILSKEAEQYARALLHFHQTKLGEAAGALRYSETLRLLWNAVNGVQTHQELAHYLDVCHENGRSHYFMAQVQMPKNSLTNMEMFQMLSNGSR